VKLVTFPDSPGRTRALPIIGVIALVAVAVMSAILGVYQQGRVSKLSSANTYLSQQDSTLAREVSQLSQEQNALSAAGKTRQSATTADLGVCEFTTTEYLDNYNPPVLVITGVTIASPTLTNGVASCPTGIFVPVTPQSP